MERIQKVLANCEQGLSNSEKAQARRNIDAQGTLTAGHNITISASNVISAADTAQVQADWAQTDSTADSYIQHKPTVPSIVKTTTTLPPTNTDIGTLKFIADGRVVGDSSDLGLIAPNGGQTDAGKVLTLHYSGSPGVATAQWDNLPSGVEIATVTHGQAGDIETPVQKLVIDEDFGQLVADNRTVGLVAPEPLPTDNGKIVAVNGDLLEYVDAPNGVFVAYYSGYSTGHGNTSFGEIQSAHADGKLVVMKYTVLGGDVLCVLDTIDSSKAVFSRTSGVLSSDNYGNVSNQVVVVWSDSTYQIKNASLVYSGGTGIDITNNVISTNIYVAEIYTENGVQKCNFAAINAANTAGKLVLLKGTGSGSFVGKLKYVQGGLALFDNFYAQPMRMSETYVRSDNSVEYQTLYVYDNTLTNTYRATRYGRAYSQIDSTENVWLPTYMNTAADVQWYQGELGTTTISLTDLMAAIANTSNYQVLKMFVTGSLCHVRDNAPSGTPQGFLRAKLVIGRKNIATGNYEFVDFAESPYAHVDCDNYTQSGTEWDSDWHNFEMEMTIDRYRLKTLGFNSSYTDPHIRLQVELVNETTGGTYHWLGIRNMTQKFTLLTHL